PTCPPCSSAPLRPPPLPTLFPYTTLFRSHPPVGRGHLNRSAGHRAARTRQPRSDGPPEYRTDLGDRPARPTRFGMNLCRKHFCADRKSTRLNSSHVKISYAVFCLKKKTTI